MRTQEWPQCLLLQWRNQSNLCILWKRLEMHGRPKLFACHLSARWFLVYLFPILQVGFSDLIGMFFLWWIICSHKAMPFNAATWTCTWCPCVPCVLVGSGSLAPRWSMDAAKQANGNSATRTLYLDSFSETCMRCFLVDIHRPTFFRFFLCRFWKPWLRFQSETIWETLAGSFCTCAF